jgi:ubiquinone/menaquinone biosynthesis C-methylase UbiE
MGRSMTHDEQEEKRCLAARAEDVLREVGIELGDSVLDYGCGRGVYAVPAAELVGPEGRVVAVDADASARAEVEEKVREYSRVEVKAPEGKTGFPVEDGSCDVILLFDVLHALEEWAPVWREAKRAVRSGGILAIYPMHVDRQEVRRQVLEVGFEELDPHDCVQRYTRA